MKQNLQVNIKSHLILEADLSNYFECINESYKSTEEKLLLIDFSKIQTDLDAKNFDKNLKKCQGNKNLFSDLYTISNYS